jgi:hypothetical protein
MRFRDRLEHAQAAPSVVRITRGSFEAEGELGYVLALADELLLLLRISNQIRFDGFAVLRIRDITELEAPHSHSHFVEEVLRLRDESVAQAPGVELADIESAIRSAGKLYPILAIHREEADPEVCHVGAVASVRPESVSLFEIDPDAEWDEEPTEYSLSEITRIEFGGGYEEALALVGGKPPSVPHLKPVS